MKTFRLFSIAAVTLALAVSCEKPQSEADKSAQVEREVQQRLAAEHQADEQQRLAQQQADLDAREKALAAKEGRAPVTKAVPTAVARHEEIPASRARVTSKDREAPRSYDTFYRKLEPYGAWRETADYGYVWQPRQAERTRDWRPYTQGRWAYTDAGWTWVSEEPFGWATYHYGRWTRLRNVGWVWVPGEEWAPAWVSWRKGDRNVGWAPLPPEARFERNTGIKRWADSYYDISADEYVFIPNEEIGSQRIETAVIPTERNVTIINQTTNVTNITYNNTTVVNEGPNFDELRDHSRQPLERMRIEREYDVQQDADPQATIRGAVISMMTPLFTAQAVERPRNVGAPLGQVQVERNWTNNANQPEAERARAKMLSEATPPPNAPPKKFEKPRVLAAAAAPASPAATTPLATATIAASPTASATGTPLPTATATPFESATPRSPSPTPVATPATTPPVTSTPVASMTPRATSTPLTTPTAPATTPWPRQRPSATPAVTATPSLTTDPATTIDDGKDAAESKRQEMMQRRAREQSRRAQDAKELQLKMEEARKELPPVKVPPTAAPSIVPSEADGGASSLPVMRNTPAKPVMTPRPLPSAASAPVESTTAVPSTPPPVKRTVPTPALTTAPEKAPTATPTPTPTPTATAGVEEAVKKAKRPMPAEPADEKPDAKATATPEGANEP